MSIARVALSVGICLVSAVAVSLSADRCLAQERGANEDANRWPRTVLITNDDGVNDPGLAALAHVFSEFSETYVVAPLEDRSGSTHYVSVYSKHVLRVAEHDLGEDVQAYGVDGYPGDCVLLALRGLMRDTPPDLVITGINSGPNLGFDWLASGTIGAARLAAAWGVPAIAASGLDTSVPGALEAASQWLGQLARSDLARSLEAGQYLTVSFPRVSPDAIKGIKVVERAGILLDFRFDRAHEEPTSRKAGIWALEQPVPIPPASSESDAALYAQNYIVVVPMRADEHDRELLARLLGQPEALPPWPRSGGAIEG